MTRIETLEAARKALEICQRQQEAAQWIATLEDYAPALVSPLEDEKAAMLAKALAERANALLMALPMGRDRVVLLQYYVLGMSAKAISRLMKCDLRTVTRAKARGLRALETMDRMEENKHE